MKLNDIEILTNCTHELIMGKIYEYDLSGWRYKMIDSLG
jgi:hypothetical protein